MKNRWALVIIVGIIAVGILAYLFRETRSVDNAAFNQAVTEIRELQRIDAAWSVEALKSQLALNQDYDVIANYLPRIRELKTNLLSGELGDPAKTTPAIANQLAKYLSLFDQKEEAIERFKTGHAVLRNSVRFLPQAGDALVSAAENNKYEELATDIKVRQKDIFSYILAPEEGRKLQINDWLQQNVMGYPQAVANPATNFISHAKLIMDRKQPTDELLEQIVSVPTSQAASELLNLYTRFHDNQLLRVDQYRLALFAYSALLLLFLALFGTRLIKNYGAVQQATALEKANETLEQNVASRTKELSDAYQRLKGSQAQLVQSSKMAAVGQLVAGVAHEINTPLGYVNGNVDFFGSFVNYMDGFVNDIDQLNQMVNEPDSDSEKVAIQFSTVSNSLTELKEENFLGDAHDLVKDAKYGLGQISDIVVSLVNFSRVDQASRELADLHDGIESTLKIAHNLIKNTATVVKSYGDIPKVICSLSQINQVILNLLNNAVHAIKAAGRDGQGVIKITTKRDGKYAYILIQDNGTGLKPDVQDRLFEPFFTTKPAGEGTGLGLSISQNIVQNHKGYLQFKSAVGKGTVFQIALPLEQTEPVMQGFSGIGEKASGKTSGDT